MSCSTGGARWHAAEQGAEADEAQHTSELRRLTPVLGGPGGPVVLTVVDEPGVKLVEGHSEAPLLSRPDDASRIIEACLSADTDAALLYPRNLTDCFFDLSSSGHAGEILQKLRNYRVRLAVVCAPGTVRFSTQFPDMLAEERRGRFFSVFETRAEAVQWLGRHTP